MPRKSSSKFIVALIFLFLSPLLALPAMAQQACFTPEARKQAEQTARVFREPDPDYNPVLGYNPAKGPRRGALRSTPPGSRGRLTASPIKTRVRAPAPRRNSTVPCPAS